MSGASVEILCRLRATPHPSYIVMAAGLQKSGDTRNSGINHSNIGPDIPKKSNFSHRRIK